MIDPNMLRSHVDALHKLLAHPQPGLSSWVAMYTKHMEAVVAIWFRGDEKRKLIETRSLSHRLQMLAEFQEIELKRQYLLATDSDDPDFAKARHLENAARENREWAEILWELKAKL